VPHSRASRDRKDSDVIRYGRMSPVPELKHCKTGPAGRD
jgi:hypothetical protein